MAEYVAVANQSVATNGNVVFTNTAVQGSNCIKHREGSGIITLRGITNQCRSRFFCRIFCKYRSTYRWNSRSNLACDCDQWRTGSFFTDDFNTSCGGTVQQCICRYLCRCSCRLLRKHCGRKHEQSSN